ncbi:DDT domain-containing protein PTM, partial [Tanacetum coccineum]
IRELDANIKWEEIENTSHLAMMDKESIKSMRSFRKATIRRKSLEGASVKYLLDFGKRRFIPDAVVKNGSKIEEPSSERKKYWVEEPYVPLFLLKPFEDRRIAYKSNKMSLSGLPVSRSVVKPSKKDVFSYLLSKPEKPENHPCGHCNKDVPVRDAISCRYCEGYFHKRHVRKTSGGTYTCHKCHVGHTLTASPKKGKLYSQKTKKVSKTSKKVGKGKQSVRTQANSKAFVVPLRRSARTAKIAPLQSKKKPVKKKKKYGGKKKQLTYTVNEVDKPKGKRGRPRKIKKESLKKQRTQLHAAYWLNGLHLSRNPDDGRITEFRTKNHLLPFALLDSISQPKCSLCDEPGFRPALNYINCETCREWYHGDAFGLKDEYTGALIGFKCHKCLERIPPVCPHFHSIIYEPNLGEEKNVLGTESGNEVSSEVLLRQGSDTVEGQKDLLSVEASPKQLNAESLPDSEHVGNGPEVSSEVLLRQESDTVEGQKDLLSVKASPKQLNAESLLDSEHVGNRPDTQGEEAENGPDAHGDDAENGPGAQEDAENRPDAQGEDAENGPDAQGEHVEKGPSAQAENAENDGSGLDAQGGDAENGPDAHGDDAENRPDAQGEDSENRPDAQVEDVENGPEAQGEHVEKGPDAQADNAKNEGSGPDAQGGDVENGADAQGEDVQNKQGLVLADALIEPCEDSAFRDALLTSKGVLEESSRTHKELSVAVAQNGFIKSKESSSSIVDGSKC